MSRQEANLRVRRTQKLLREALIALIEERGFEALTVSELTARAMVSRAAFYRNYQDKYDLVEQIFAETMSDLLESVDDLGMTHPTESWVRFFEHIADQARLYRALLGEHGSPWFARKMHASLMDLIRTRGRTPHGPGVSERPLHAFADDLVPVLVATMLIEAINWWLAHDMSHPPKQMAERSARLAAAIFREASRWSPASPSSPSASQP